MCVDVSDSRQFFLVIAHRQLVVMGEGNEPSNMLIEHYMNCTFTTRFSMTDWGQCFVAMGQSSRWAAAEEGVSKALFYHFITYTLIQMWVLAMHCH